MGSGFDPLAPHQGRCSFVIFLRGSGHDESRAGYTSISSPTIELDGDRATSGVMWTVIQRDPDRKPRLSILGRHVDDLVREDGRQKIARRRGLVDLPQVMPVESGPGSL